MQLLQQTGVFDPDFGINIKTTNGISVRYIADEGRIITLKGQLVNEMAGFTVERVGNNLTVTGSGSGWTYSALIVYTSAYVLSKMTEIFTNGAGVETVVWEKLGHDPGPGCDTGDVVEGTEGDVPGFPLIFVFSAFIIGVVFVSKRKNLELRS